MNERELLASCGKPSGCTDRLGLQSLDRRLVFADLQALAGGRRNVRVVLLHAAVRAGAKGDVLRPSERSAGQPLAARQGTKRGAITAMRQTSTEGLVRSVIF